MFLPTFGRATANSAWNEIHGTKFYLITTCTPRVKAACFHSMSISLAADFRSLNYFRYTDRSDKKIIVDRVIRYENLLAELGEVLAHLNIPFNGTLGVAAKSENRADRRPYQEVFNNEQRRIVEKAFAKEIELHGYRFEQ